MNVNSAIYGNPEEIARKLDLLRQSGAHLVCAEFVIDLPELGGADRLRAAGVAATALVSFSGH